MKKLLGIVVLSLLLSSNAYALSLSCKSEHNGETITDTTYDLSEGSEHRPEYTKTHIYWRTWRFNHDSTLAMAIYNSVDRYSGAFLGLIQIPVFLRVPIFYSRIERFTKG